MRMYDIIRKKRDGVELSADEIAFFIKGYVSGEIPDYHASALLMAIYLRGMTAAETAVLTDYMARSGDMVDLSRFGSLSVDKHSTGGVGDKTTLIAAPIAAALGCRVAKMSGRGLGHTGGTVDKLESIPGYNISPSPEKFLSTVERVGMAIVGQTGNLTPADKMLYALRDVTATVDSIPLITSSIMSKKLAAGSHSIVLDVKVGSGAFMKTEEEAEQLARNMVDIGKRCGRNMAAVLTNMDAPLGNAVGNALEVAEAAAVLRGEKKGDLYEISLALAENMVSLVYGEDYDAAARVREAVESGAAYKKMCEWVEEQGGDSRCLADDTLLPKPQFKYNILCERDGFITAMDAEGIGVAAMLLGAGRRTKEDKIDYSAGIIINKKIGDRVLKGEPLCTLYTSNKDLLTTAAQQYSGSVKIGEHAPSARRLIYKIIK